MCSTRSSGCCVRARRGRIFHAATRRIRRATTASRMGARGRFRRHSHRPGIGWTEIDFERRIPLVDVGSWDVVKDRRAIEPDAQGPIHEIALALENDHGCTNDAKLLLAVKLTVFDEDDARVILAFADRRRPTDAPTAAATTACSLPRPRCTPGEPDGLAGPRKRSEGEGIRTSLACPLDRLEPYDPPRLRRFLKNVEQPRRKLQSASVDGSFYGRPDRLIRIGYRPKTAPWNVRFRLFLGQIGDLRPD